MFSKRVLLGICVMAVSALALTACGKPTEDPSVKITQIAQTVQAEMTQNALLTPSPTATVPPTATATPVPATPTPSGPTATVTPIARATMPAGSSADNAKYITDVTVPDGTVFTADSTFTKTWRIQNTGTTTWTTNYSLVYLEGVLGTGDMQSVKLTKEVKPGESIDISVNFTAPKTNGSYISWWRMFSASGYLFGESLNVQFNVGTASATVTPTP